MALTMISGQDSFVPIPPPVKRPMTVTPFATAVPIAAVSGQQAEVMAVPSSREAQGNTATITTNALDDATVEVLKQQGYSLGLANSLTVVKENFAKRIFIVDNSGSMQRNDGHRMVDIKERGVIKIVPCTRWEEVRESINYHIRLSGLIQAPTSFRLLNHPGASIGTQTFGVAEHGCSRQRITSDIEQGLYIMGCAQPTGCTPLTDHMRDIYNELCDSAPDLRANGQRISVTICTDGLPSDPYGRGGPEHNRAFVDSLRRLEGLPVWIVIRLCTDEDNVVDFYNNLDGQLEVSIEVLDDFTGEAQEVHQVNPWLNYGLPLHRLRELGFHDRVLDMLDERALTLTELRSFCGLLFGRDKMEGVPDPSENWAAFRNAVHQLMKTEKLQWNPRSRRMEPWLDIKMLDFLYGDACHKIMEPLVEERTRSKCIPKAICNKCIPKAICNICAVPTLFRRNDPTYHSNNNQYTLHFTLVCLLGIYFILASHSSFFLKIQNSDVCRQQHLPFLTGNQPCQFGFAVERRNPLLVA